MKADFKLKSGNLLIDTADLTLKVELIAGNGNLDDKAFNELIEILNILADYREKPINNLAAYSLIQKLFSFLPEQEKKELLIDLRNA